MRCSSSLRILSFHNDESKTPGKSLTESNYSGVIFNNSHHSNANDRHMVDNFDMHKSAVGYNPYCSSSFKLACILPIPFPAFFSL